MSSNKTNIMRGMSQQAYRELWIRRVEEWAQSGLTLSAFAYQNDYSRSLLSDWVRRLRKGSQGATSMIATDSKARSNAAIIPVRVQTEPASLAVSSSQKLSPPTTTKADTIATASPPCTLTIRNATLELTQPPPAAWLIELIRGLA